MLIFLLCLQYSVIWAATPPNSPITNSATASYSVGANKFSATSTASVNTAACIDVGLKIELLQYVPAASAALAPVGTRMETVQLTGYALHGALSGPFIALGSLTLPTQLASTPLPASLLLAPLNDATGKSNGTYSRNEPVFVRVVSYDANLNPAVADTVSVTLTTSSGDAEVLQLSETGPATGIFVGAVPSVFAALGSASTANDGKITVTSHNESISAVYKHADCRSGVTIASSSSGLIDPYGVVFDSATGAPVNGALISKINTLTSLLATVYCDDGVTVLAQPITSGSPTACDASVAPGGYHFPRVAAGSYKLVVNAPPGFSFPSSVLPSNLPVTIGVPTVTSVIMGSPGLMPGASYGGVFLLAGPALRIDLPVDAGNTSLSIQKSADKTVVGHGEFVPYTLTITNSSATKSVANALIADHLPPGFRYQKGSARLNGEISDDPWMASDARTLRFTLKLAPAAVVRLRYVLAVTPAAPTGMAENTAAATGGYSSNTARASVLVREDLFHSKAVLIGRVIDGSCDDKEDVNAKGLANARIVLQDGSYVLTDKEGRWHIDNLRPGTHVVQLDLDSLPKDYQANECEPNSRFAGRSYSQFVNLRGGTLWRADFHVQKKAGSAQSVAEVPGLTVVPSQAAALQDSTQLVEKLPFDALWLESAAIGNEWLHPQEDFHPNLPVMKVVVKHDPKHTLTLSVNGEMVKPLLFDGVRSNVARSVALSSWNAVPVNEGANKVELVIHDEGGREVSRTLRTIQYAQAPDHVELVRQQSRLIADGKTRPLIAIRFMDKSGVPVRRGLTGEFQLNEPYFSYDRRVGLEREPLTGRLDGQSRFEIKDDGLALIELEPTTQSGEAILNFQFGDQRKQEVRAWLQAGQRDWILVGFAEGSTGHKTLAGNLEALQAADAENQLFDGNKLAFYAKGSIRGDYLLTVAYDTTKQTGNNLLKQAVDPNQYYTLYGDASQARFDAASASRLYVKLERAQFFAMFGDYDTGLSVTELSRYSRTLNGLKSEYKGETFGYNAFASITAQAYAKDEIAGNGTSGVYRLSRSNLMINADKVRIETRDRFQTHIILDTRYLTRYLDYDIDYSRGTLTFREPIAVRDGNFNPIYIVAEYESADPADSAATLGGRASFKPSKESEIGATLIHEGTVGATGNLQGLDATYQLGANTKLRTEFATSQRNLAGVASSGSAWLGEVQRHENDWDAKAYVREQAPGFGLGQQASLDIGTRKMGIDGRLKLSDTQQVQGQAYKQENLSTGAQNTVLQARLDQKLSDDLSAYYGVRSAQDKGEIEDSQGQQLIGGMAYTMADKQLALHAAAEISMQGVGSLSMPDRVILGADYRVTEQTKLFAEQEFAQGVQMTANAKRAGVRTQVWTGGEAAASVGSSNNNDAGRLYSNLGLVQRWQINPHWRADFSLDRSQTMRDTPPAMISNNYLAFGSPSGDYTTAAIGAAYFDALWSGNARIESRHASPDQQKNLYLGMQRKLEGGRSLGVSWVMRQAENGAGSTRDSDLRWSYAHRPAHGQWVWFDRADYITQASTTAASTLKSTKLVNNLSANYRPNRQTQITLQYGAKYVQDAIDGTDYKGFTDLIGFEIRRDLSKDWDVGVFASVMRSVNVGVRDYGAGVSLGYNVMDNLWLSLGYNVRGLDDRDFNEGDFSARGLFVSLRMKVDQDTFGLNSQDGTMHPIRRAP